MNRDFPEKQLAGIYTGIGSLEVREVPVPPPNGDQCLIKVDRCGICGSDLNTYRGQSSRTTFEEWMKIGYADGHEYTGTVVAVGDQVRSIAVGVRVAVECTRHCGVCDACRRGLYNICVERKDLVWRGNGGFAQFATAPEHAVYQVPDNVTPTQAALIEPAACALRALRRSNFLAGASFLVVGGGTIGLLAAQMARVLTQGDVYLVYKYDHQCEAAHALGIDNTLKIEELTLEIADIAIDAVGNENSFNGAMAGVKRGGTVVLIGSPTGPLEVCLGQIVGKELNVYGALTYAHQASKSDFHAVIDLMAAGVFDPTALVSHTFPLAEIEQAFITALDKKTTSIKVHIVQ